LTRKLRNKFIKKKYSDLSQVCQRTKDPQDPRWLFKDLK
jgi:hypothetical protein